MQTWFIVSFATRCNRQRAMRQPDEGKSMFSREIMVAPGVATRSGRASMPRILHRSIRAPPSLVRCSALCLALAAVLALAAFALPTRAADEGLSVNARLLVAARALHGAVIARALQHGAAIDSRNLFGESAL